MSVKKLFWVNPYQTELQTKVSSVDGNKVTLEDTIFFAFSGGQESDRGSIGGYEVLEAKKVGKEISYTLPDEHTLKAGDTVDVVIDEETRLNLMKLHFAAELVLVIVTENYGHPEKTGAHISPDKARIDFAWEGSIASILPEVSARLIRLLKRIFRSPVLLKMKVRNGGIGKLKGWGKFLAAARIPGKPGNSEKCFSNEKISVKVKSELKSRLIGKVTQERLCIKRYETYIFS